MIRIPTIKPSQTQFITTAAGVGIAVLGYFFPALIPALAPLGKLLWAGGFFTGGVGAVQLVQKPKLGGP